MNSTSTERPSRLFSALAALVALVLAGAVLLRLSAYGIWDPWELAVADAARKLGEDGAIGHASSLPLRLVQASFAMFGTREWAGRLPAALCGLGYLATIALWTRRYAGGRAALYAAVAIGSTPLFMLHSREMVGATPGFLAAALVAIGACNAVFRGRTDEGPLRTWLWLLVSVAGGLLACFAGGVMLAVLPGLGAVALTALLRGTPWDAEASSERRGAAWAVTVATGVLGVLVGRAVFQHAASYSVWTGGVPLDEAVPTFERAIAHLFHGLAPWSAVVPVALGAMVVRGSEARADAPLRLVCTLWGGLAFAAVTIYMSAYGGSAFPAPAAVAIAAALWLADLEENPRAFWPELVVVLLLLGLIIRDYALYPGSPVAALELANAPVPDKFNPKLSWSIVLGLFGVGLTLSCMATPERGVLDLRAPYRGLKSLMSASGGHRAWLAVIALVWLGLVLFGVISVARPPGVKLSSLARTIGRGVGAFALILPLLVAMGQWLYHQSRLLAPVRNVPVLIGALAVGVYAAQLFLPRLSAHFSPREVFDTFAQVAGPNEPLAQHQVPGRAAAYYVNREVRDIATQPELVNFLAEPGRRWALLPSERFADLDVAFRRRTGKHLYVPSAENARVSLVASQPIDGRPDQNPLTKYVLTIPPKVTHRLDADFEGKIELIGYDLELPHPDYVGPGQTFTVSWVFRALRSNLDAYQAFLHVDAEGQRINGDHDPVDGMYPVRLWTQGDIVVDRQRVSVPATATPGTYTMYVGFFRGETRLKVSSGPKDDTDRVIAGKVQIR
ncbi:MAG: glycosyltransferase family 39 protein [Polyangiales bacterium]